MTPAPGPPILAAKQHDAPSVFRPENLLREARRQKNLPLAPVPAICLLDPDGDIVHALRQAGRARRDEGWACYHTDLYLFTDSGHHIGAIACAVGAPFAVLLAEQLFASGCRLLVSITSAGQIIPSGPTPYFVLIDRALRDEGTSYHYLPPADFAEAPTQLTAAVAGALGESELSVYRGASWTTDAPFRETEAAIARARAAGALAVEMEAAALYAFAAARIQDVPLLCACHQPDGASRRRLREGRGERCGRRAPPAGSHHRCLACDEKLRGTHAP